MRGHCLLWPPSSIPVIHATTWATHTLTVGERVIAAPAPASTTSNVTAVTKLSLTWLHAGPHQLTPICNLTSLRHLDLSFGRLSGPLLPCIANLRHLRYLDLSENLLDSIPPSSLAQLPHLQTLFLYDNAFADTISLISAALPSSLRILDLRYNRIQGSIPGSFFDLHPSLQQLYLDDNSLSGTLPESMYNLTQLQAITLQFLTTALQEGSLPASTSSKPCEPYISLLITWTQLPSHPCWATSPNL